MFEYVLVVVTMKKIVDFQAGMTGTGMAVTSCSTVSVFR